MKLKFSSYVVFIVLILGFLTWHNRNYIRIRLDFYALKMVQDRYGTQPLAPEQEAKIRHIAQEMNIVEPIIIRKMNHQTLRTFGYYNAFACFAQFMNSIPLSNKPFMFVSEGFFKDLSPEEQRFLIGHELIHIKEHHTQYSTFLYWFFVIILFLGVFWLHKKRIIPIIDSREVFKNQRHFRTVFVSLLFYISLVIPNLCHLAYRRHIEWVADEQSLLSLQSYEGGLKLFDRWQNDFKLPLHNHFYGLLADHPSCYERKMYCLHLKNKSKDLL